MEGNIMNTEEVVEFAHMDGPTWEIVSRCNTYEEANQRRLELAMREGLQVKVHWQGEVNNRYFAVKTRQDPDIVKREEKKRRKAKLNKKRRKK
jgi:hypothetical protein